MKNNSINLINLPILITRAQPDANISVKNWQQAGLNAIATPLMKFSLLANKFNSSLDYKAVIFTSANGVRALEQKGLINKLNHLPIFCVGESCARYAKEAGFSTINFAGGDIDSLLFLLKRQTEKIDNPILYPRAQHIRKNIKEHCKSINLIIKDYICYEMQPIDISNGIILKQVKEQQSLVISLYSVRVAKILFNLLQQLEDQTDFSNITLLCLSKNIADVFLTFPLAKKLIAKQTNDAAMIALALKLTND